MGGRFRMAWKAVNNGLSCAHCKAESDMLRNRPGSHHRQIVVPKQALANVQLCRRCFLFHMVLSGEARVCCGILEMAYPTPGWPWNMRAFCQNQCCDRIWARG